MSKRGISAQQQRRKTANIDINMEEKEAQSASEVEVVTINVEEGKSNKASPTENINMEEIMKHLVEMNKKMKK